MHIHEAIETLVPMPGDLFTGGYRSGTFPFALADLKRRHLTDKQRAMVAAKLAKLPAHRPVGDNQTNSPTYSMTQAQAAVALNISERAA
jgi:hypothetical protein